MKNTGSVVGGAMWLKNLTPAGILTGLVVNYGYEQVLKLMEGNIELAKEHLTTYFQAHDEDITPEQASYLANCAMKVLQTAGQIAVHQVAAKGFQAVKKGVGRSEKAGKKGVENVKNLNGLSRREVNKILKKSGFELRGETPNWKTYKHADGSRIDISSEGRIVRTQAPKYSEDGRRVNKGQRVSSSGEEIPRDISHDQHPTERMGDSQ